MRLFKGLAAAVVKAVTLAGAVLPVHAHASVKEFCESSNVTLIIGYSVGGGNDRHARLAAGHLRRFISGNPTIIPENMPGAGRRKTTGSLRLPPTLVRRLIKAGDIWSN